MNKANDSFQFNTDAERTDVGNKWTLASLMRRLATDGVDTARLWAGVVDVVTKAVRAAS